MKGETSFATDVVVSWVLGQHMCYRRSRATCEAGFATGVVGLLVMQLKDWSLVMELHR